ncbi:hypothetical protein ANRL1_01467 [Anaerolineae bacterium]|nr:hypothetical protein ANRL1_01467 [Anaerolineae bacterium]
MIPLYEVAWEIHRFFTRHKIPYAIIGGFAVQQWGVPRFTADVDAEMLAPLTEGSENFVRLILSEFSSRDNVDPFTRAKRDRVVLISASNGRGIDISFGVPEYQDELLARAVDYKLARGKVVRVCSAEDLIIHKCVAGRDKDLRDVEGVIARQGELLDVAYIRKWLKLFDEQLPEPHAVADFERAWRVGQRTALKRDRKPVRRLKHKR